MAKKKAAKMARPEVKKKLKQASKPRAEITQNHFKEQHDIVIDFPVGVLRYGGKLVRAFSVSAADKNDPLTKRQIKQSGGVSLNYDSIEVPIDSANEECRIRCQIEDPHPSNGRSGPKGSGKLTITIKPIT